MPTRKAHARWEGNLKGGKGSMKLGSGAFEGQYSFGSRFESGSGTNPEELLGAAHAGCFSMALSLMLGEEGFEPEFVDTDANVSIEQAGGGFKITSSKLTTRAKVPGIDKETFMKHANAAKEGCPVSQALAGVDISLDAELVE